MKCRIRAPRLPQSLGLLLVALGALGGDCTPNGDGPPGRTRGVLEYQQPGLVAVPGGVVNVPARNLLVRRTDLSIDTRLGTYNLGATYNAAGSSWLWTFDITYDGTLFVDGSGAVHNVGGLASGEAIPGTHWVVLDAATLRTKGGLVHEFDANGRLAVVRWASADWPRLAFVSGTVAGEPHTTRIDQCTAADSCTDFFTIGYDASGRVVSVADRAGRLAEFTWNAEGRLASARDGLDTAEGWPGFRYEYTSGGKLSAITSSEGERIEYRFARRQLEIEQIGAGNPLHTFRYAGSAQGLHTTEYTDPLGHVMAYVWDGQRRLRSAESLDTGEVLRFTWSGLRPVERVLPDGATTTWTYAGDDVATETRPSGNVLTFSYEPDAVDRTAPLGRPIARIDDSLGLVEQRSYDGQGRLVSVTNGAGETTSFTYGPDETVASRTDAAGVVTSYADHGEHGHPTTVSRGDATGERVYDAVGNLLEIRGAGLERGGIARRDYDADRNVSALHLRSLVEAQQGPVEMLWVDHRSDGQQLGIQRPHGDDAELVYDGLGRLVERREKVDGQWRSTTFERDALGRTTARQRPNGMREETTYDPLGRVATRATGRGNPLVVESTVAFTYEDGRRVETLDSVHGAPETIQYDAAGRPHTVAYPDGEVLQLFYDVRSRLTSATFWIVDSNFVRTLEFAYDGADREVSVVDDGDEVLARVYDLGRLVEARYGNGLVRTYDHDAQGEYIGGETVDASGAVVASTTFGPGHFFSIPVVTNAIATPNGLTEGTGALFELNPTLDEATPRAGPRLSAVVGGGEWRFPDFDALSNVTRMGDFDQPAGGDAYTYNAEHNRLLSIGNVHTYAYDAAGFATDRDGVPLTWDGAGRIATVGGEASFLWDTQGRMVSSTVMGVTRQRLFGGRMKADAAGSPAVLDLGEVRIDLATRARRYRHLDFRGNVAFVTDDAGQIVAQYQYGAFGVQEAFGDPGEGPSFARGRALDGLVLLGHRVLDTDAGRFLSPDPVYQLVNQYAYALGNPVYFWDPAGRDPVEVEINNPTITVNPRITIKRFGIDFNSGVTITITFPLIFDPIPVLVGRLLEPAFQDAFVGFGSPTGFGGGGGLGSSPGFRGFPGAPPFAQPPMPTLPPLPPPPPPGPPGPPPLPPQSGPRGPRDGLPISGPGAGGGGLCAPTSLSASPTDRRAVLALALANALLGAAVLRGVRRGRRRGQGGRDGPGQRKAR